MRLVTTVFAVAAFAFAGCASDSPHTAQSINPILGDQSFVAAFGHEPTETTGEDLRIRTHLQHVEGVLRATPVGRLSSGQQARRAHLIALLHAYWQTGIFPRNYDHPEGRVPCFIDRGGRICAVGYLIEQTAGRAVAEGINQDHQYDELLAMNEPVIDDWLAQNGLTGLEAAMIQPTYGPAHHIEPVPRGYAIGTAVLSGGNTALSAVNTVQLQTRPTNRAVAIVGLLTGAGQIVLGVAKYPKEEMSGLWGGVVPSNNSLRAVSMVNVSVGTATTVLSAWNLLTPLSKDGRLRVTAVGFPTEGGGVGAGLSFTKTF